MRALPEAQGGRSPTLYSSSPMWCVRAPRAIQLQFPGTEQLIQNRVLARRWQRRVRIWSGASFNPVSSEGLRGGRRGRLLSAIPRGTSPVLAGTVADPSNPEPRFPSVSPHPFSFSSWMSSEAK